MERERIGCAGWSIQGQHAGLFPREGTHLERYATVFDCVEINSSFYRPHQPRTYAKWAACVPAGFRFSVKMPKSISHLSRLRHCDSLLEGFLAQVEQLGDKLGVLLLQLPPSLAFDDRGALRFFDHLVRAHAGPVACEPRHRSWFTAQVERALRDRGIARVASDPAVLRRAAIPGGSRRLEYLRLHGSPRMYYDAYPPAVLDRIARHLAREDRATRECWCIFDNTALGHATDDAMLLKRRL
jgi:uncharacterized protein YecE (DUF72 family)